jgi:leucyl aminopeptidase
MLAKLTQSETTLSQAHFKTLTHLLVVLPKAESFSHTFPGETTLRNTLKRRSKKIADLIDEPIAAQTPEGKLAAWVMLDPAKSRFEQLTALRKAVKLLLDESPAVLHISVHGAAAERKLAAELAVYCAWLNGAALPTRKSKSDAKPLKQILLFGYRAADGFAAQRAVAEGNTLTRELTLLPPNDLTPRTYRARIAEIAKEHGWKRAEFDMKKLREIGAGAFVAVAQGSHDDDAAIVRLTYAPRGAKRRIALVGKGVCFDTGGHNLKSSKYMYGMHGDMNGSAVVLGIMHAAAQLKLPLAIDGWLALVQNNIGPKAYKQNDVVKAINGTTIEIIHTDAEGRMILSDTLALAAREKPEVIIDFATLTGSMHVALGSRYSGIIGNRDEWVQRAIAAGRQSGERVASFPMDADYDKPLESKIADVKQCSADSYADHILAARFLSRFIDERPWLHMDLSASESEGGLGAVASDVTGLGGAWGVELLITGGA